MTELYVVKHVADRVANEPRNVGVIAATGRGADSRVATRFLGVDLDGTSVRRPLPGVPKNIYLAWVNYFRVKTREGRWEDIARARRRRPQDFYLDHVLTILDSDDVERIADEYFSRLVRTAGRSGKKMSPTEHMRHQVDAVFDELGLSPDRDVSLEATLNGRDVRVAFDYALPSASPVLLDRLSSHDLRSDGQAFAFRTMMARQAHRSDNFAAFIDLSGVADEGDLRAVESVATVIDPVGDYNEALSIVAELAGI